MKKILMGALLAGVLFESALMAGIYVGADVITGDSITYTRKYDNGVSTLENTVDTVESGYKLKVGFGELGGSTFEIYYASMSSDKYYMLSKDLMEIGLDFKPSWEITDNFYFNIPLGVNYGTTQADSTLYDSSTWGRIGAKIGVSVSYVVMDHVELLAGYDYKLSNYPKLIS